MPTRRRIAQQNILLKGFTEPDTGSQFEGWLSPGKYIVKDYKPGKPNDDTDYALVLAPAMGAGDTWICTRWKDQRYAEITEIEESPADRLSFEDDPQAVPEEALLKLLPEFEDFTYDLDEARYPFSLPGVRLPLAPPQKNNCCTFVEALLVRAWGNHHENFKWGPKRHSQMMIISDDDFYSPITAVVRKKMAVAVTDPDTPPHPWTVLQGWRKRWRGGHTFIIVDHHEPTDRVLTLESNSSYRLNGVGFRSIGNLRNFDSQVPDHWWEQGDLWTWERIQATYRHRRQGWLKVRNRSWSQL